MSFPGLGVSKWSPGVLLLYNAAILAFLLVILWARYFEWGNLERIPLVLGAVLPLLVTWAGALGGVSKSLVGLAGHWSKMAAPSPDTERSAASAVRHTRQGEKVAAARRQWNAWHLTRPVAGAIFGTVATLMGVLVLGTVGLTAGAEIDLTERGIAILSVISFSVGYQQEAFRRLIDRVLEVVLGPGTPAAAAKSATEAGTVSLAPSAIEFRETSQGSPVTERLLFSNRTNHAIRLQSADFNVEPADFSLAIPYPYVASGQERELVVTFTPNSQTGPVTGTLTFKAQDGERTVGLAASVK